ncbi:MAG: RecQ family ATP-dependent DNA helicase [Bacteroidetes bacterium]|nr:RecQ family ATP-dependent DNA helicase [Bacteroidota bacterium]
MTNKPEETPDLLALLRQYWHYNSFRPRQEEIIRSVLAGKDTLALLPTGGGKSLCFQVPAMAKSGLCLVVSPLIALMKDQTDSLRKKNITAFSLHSGLSRKEVINTLQLSAGSNCKFLYVSPERLESPLFLEYLPSLNVSLIAVDEAHCVSQWGYDFRPPYLRIATLRDLLPDIPILALTASATSDVMEDIQEKLKLDTPAVFRLPFTRPRLSYSLFTVSNKLQKIAEILSKVSGSAIVYCKTRKATRDISEGLSRLGIPALAYHAGLPQEERIQRQESWLKDKVRVIVSTNAFGMGIDKAAVRAVIHADPPESIENYYQESGRAGRDGDKAYAVLLTAEGEAARREAMPDARFPSMDKIRPIYQHLMNYLQLPAGSGEGSYFDFDLMTFVDRFDLEMSAVMNVLKVLEQDGLLSFQQQVFLPARVQFITGKETLYDFEKDRPELEPLIHALLRTYEGIFDQPVAIRERQLAWLLHKQAPQVTADLTQLHAFRIIDYTPIKESPQLYFFRNRAATEELYIDPVSYRERKEQYSTRIRAMIRYLGLVGECRSRYLAHYFGDKEAGDCGICDNCLQQAKRKETPAARRR